MNSFLRKTLKLGGYSAGALAAAAGLYVGAAFVFSRITVPKAAPDAAPDVTIYLHSNGVHTDIVVPIRTAQMDWSQQLSMADVPAPDASLDHIAFGWGDKGFYLDTPTWADLKFSTAFVAAFWLGSSAVHVTYLPGLAPGPDTVPLHLSWAEYARLVAYIQNSFRYDAAGRVQHVKDHSYGPHDAFYEAHRVYSFLYTCNTWTNNALKASGQRACLWTPADAGILHQYGR